MQGLLRGLVLALAVLLPVVPAVAQEPGQEPSPECVERQQAMDKEADAQQFRLARLLRFLDSHGVPYTSLHQLQDGTLRVDPGPLVVKPDFADGPARLSVGVGRGCSLPQGEPFVCVMGAVTGGAVCRETGCGVDGSGLTFGVRLYPRDLQSGTRYIPVRGAEGLSPESDIGVAYERTYVLLGSDLLQLREHTLEEFFDLFDRFATANP